MRILGYVAAGVVLLLVGARYSWQPVVRITREWPGPDTTRWKPEPWESVRLLGAVGAEGCVPFRVLARLYVHGRLFGPSNEAVHRALRRHAGNVGANAVAFTTPSMDDLPVLGLLDRFWQDGDEAEALRYTEEQSGRAVAVRCLPSLFRPSPNSQSQAQSLIEHDSTVAKPEPGPHNGGGRTTGYSFFAQAPNLSLVFRKRVLHPGAAIGYHRQEADEIYYVLSGRGTLILNGARSVVERGTAILTRAGSSHSLQQLGTEDLVIIVTAATTHSRSHDNLDR